MFVAAAHALSAWSPARKSEGAALYPPLEAVRDVSRDVAIAVAREAQRAGLCSPGLRDLPVNVLERLVTTTMWEPRYASYVPANDDTKLHRR
jgi:malate dehydrogenase (oxaloacetate-decarboxylating)